MTPLIIWACILGYLAIGWLIVTPKLAVTRLKVMTERQADMERGWVLGTSVALGIIWPACIGYIKGSNAYDKTIEEEQMLERVRREIEEQKKLERRRAQAELEAFDRAMKEQQ